MTNRFRRARQLARMRVISTEKLVDRFRLVILIAEVSNFQELAREMDAWSCFDAPCPGLLFWLATIFTLSQIGKAWRPHIYTLINLDIRYCAGEQETSL